MKPDRFFFVKVTLLVLAVMVLVCAPFILWGESFVFPLLEAQQHRTGLLVLMAITLLAADAVAPVPATLVVMFLAAKAGVWAGILGGTLGLAAGVLTSAWMGKAAVGRVAPAFFPEGELARVRAGLQRNLVLTLACWRSVPILAETSVILAAAAGVPLRRIFAATLLPNLVIAVIYSVAADDSFVTAIVAFLVTLGLSYGLWRWQREKASDPI